MAELSFFVFPNFSKQTRAQSGTPKGTRRMGGEQLAQAFKERRTQEKRARRKAAKRQAAKIKTAKEKDVTFYSDTL